MIGGVSDLCLVMSSIVFEFGLRVLCSAWGYKEFPNIVSNRMLWSGCKIQPSNYNRTGIKNRAAEIKDYRVIITLLIIAISP